MRPLSLLETRVLGVLVEKAHTVPDSYPLSLNTLTLGCNQKTARDPVITAGEGEVQGAIDELRALSLVFESSGSRVTRYEHNTGRVLGLPSQSVALLAVLMLRGPQTTSELRTNSERLHRFADSSSVEGFLEELASRPADKGGSLVVRLLRAPGSREPRWAHLLSGPHDDRFASTSADGETRDHGDAVLAGEVGALKARLTAAEAEIATLRDRIDRLCTELGLSTEQTPADPPAP